MKANSRRRVLISSMCMLLVALVALSTATFAWFSSNKSVTANGMTVQAAAAKGLVISIDNQTSWENADTFSAFTTNNTLVPVSLDYSTDGALNDTLAAEGNTTGKDVAFYPENVNDAEGGVWSTGKTTISSFKPASLVSAAETGEGKGKNDYFAIYEVAVKSTGDPISDVVGKISYTADPTKDAASYIRFAVLEQGANKVQDFSVDQLLAVYGNEDSPNAIASDAPSTEAQALTAFEATTTDSPKSYQFTSIDSLTKDAPMSYTILVWFEGQDGQCIDDLQQAVGNISVNFSYQ